MRLNRLFWKIFLAVWLTSLSVIIVTVIVIGEVAERNSARRMNEYRATEMAQIIIERLEAGAVYNPDAVEDKSAVDLGVPPPPPNFFDDHDRPVNGKRHRAPLPLLIYNDKGNLVYGRENKQVFANSLKFSITADTGKYRVIVPSGKVSNSVNRLLGLLFSFQSVFILIGSLVASLLLSFVVVRPVNRLRRHVQQFHNGDHLMQIEPALLGRGDEIGELAREFDVMAGYVERMLQGQQRLFEDVSHELRAPLARLQAASGLAEQKLGTDDRIVNRMNMECERLSRLIDEMLSLARLDHIDARQGTFDVVEQIRSEIDDVSFSQPDRPVKLLIANKDDSKSHWVGLGNGELFSRALGNVVGNILKHTEPDCRVDIEVSIPKAHRIRVVITDYGTGVPEDTLSSLFEPFYRQNQRTKGYGLGLSIAKRAAERLGGYILAENVEGKGLSVTIEVPAR
ncbi:sensor histidine kinase [Neptunomonas sp.]|uniref:sensor histidine kinase n=1 Tax=Neptunomonas TaxID=75687 RepID=UPI00351874A4